MINIDEYMADKPWFNNGAICRVKRQAESFCGTDEELLEKLHGYEKTLIDTYYRKLKRWEGLNYAGQFLKTQKIFFRTNSCEQIIISGIYEETKLRGKYKIIVYPYYDYNVDINTCIEVEAKDNCLEFYYDFAGEQPYLLNIRSVENEDEFETGVLSVYALNEDIYGKCFLKGDFHVHTDYSDGVISPALTVAAARKCGLDFIAVTDHDEYEGSIVAEKAAAELDCNITVIRGEELSSSFSPIHIISLGAKQPVNRYYCSNEVVDSDRVCSIRESLSENMCNKTEYACIQNLFRAIHENGGISILCHPLWKPVVLYGKRLDVRASLIKNLIINREFDALEVVSGSPAGQSSVSVMQNQLAQYMGDDYGKIPLTGVTDSHNYNNDEICGKHYTIVISDSKEPKDILDAVRKGLSVAVDEVNQKNSQCYGSFRFIKLAYFLIDVYFPTRDVKALCDGINAMERLKRN